VTLDYSISEECELHLMRGCTICSGKDRKTGEVEQVTTAQFLSRCPRCGKYIELGDFIGLVDGDWICCYRRRNDA
jgi:hypothetical protein